MARTPRVVATKVQARGFPGRAGPRARPASRLAAKVHCEVVGSRSLARSTLGRSSAPDARGAGTSTTVDMCKTSKNSSTRRSRKSMAWSRSSTRRSRRSVTTTSSSQSWSSLPRPGSTLAVWQSQGVLLLLARQTPVAGDLPWVTQSVCKLAAPSPWRGACCFGAYKIRAPDWHRARRVRSRCARAPSGAFAASGLRCAGRYERGRGLSRRLAEGLDALLQEGDLGGVLGSVDRGLVGGYGLVWLAGAA